MLQSVIISLSLAEFTQIEVRADKALVSRAFDGSSATLNALDTLMDKALFVDFQKSLLLLYHFNFFLNNPLDRFIARTAAVIHLFFFVRNRHGFLFYNTRRFINTRRFNNNRTFINSRIVNNNRTFILSLNLRVLVLNFDCWGLILLLDHISLWYSDDVVYASFSLLLFHVLIVLLKSHDLCGFALWQLICIGHSQVLFK